MADVLDKNNLIDTINALTVDGEFSQTDVQYLLNWIISNGDITGSPRDMIQIRRGNFENLPNLAQGEMAYTYDTDDLFIGGLNGNVRLGKNKDYVSVKDFGAKGNGVDDDTLSFKAAIQTGKVVIVPKSENYYKISDPLLLVNSFIGVGMPELRISQNGNENTKLLSINNYSGNGLHVSGLFLNGGYVGGTLGEQSHLVRIAKSKNVYVHDNVLKGAYGDCVYVGSMNAVTDRGISTNIHIYNNVLDTPRRCAVAVVYAKNVWIRDNVINDPYGYVGAIDIEPNPDGNEEMVTDVWIDGNIFYSESFFVNVYNPPTMSTPVERISIRNNRGRAHYFFRSTTGVSKDIVIDNNYFYGSVGDARMFLITAVPTGLTITNNDDQSTGANGWRITNTNYPRIAGNRIKSNRARAMVFYDCDGLIINDNIFIDIYSASGVITIEGSRATINHRITNNQIINCDYGVVFNLFPVTNVVIDGNFIDTARRGIMIAESATTSKINITSSNKIIGLGLPVWGGQYAGNQGVGYKLFISSAPSFVGEIAINSGNAYIGVGTETSADWKQITNV